MCNIVFNNSDYFFFFFISKFCSKIVVKYIYLLVICLEVKLFYIVNKNFKVIMIIFIYFMNNLIFYDRKDIFYNDCKFNCKMCKEIKIIKRYNVEKEIFI